MSDISPRPEEDRFDWAESGDLPPTENSQLPEEPPQSRQDTGWGYGEPPPHRFFNWIIRAITRWVYWLEEKVDGHVHDGGEDERSVDKVDFEAHIDYSDPDGNEAESLEVLQNTPLGFVIRGPVGFGAIIASIGGNVKFTTSPAKLLDGGDGEYVTHRSISEAGSTLRTSIAPDIQAPSGTKSALILDRGLEVDDIRSFNTPAQVFLRARFGILEDPQDSSTYLFRLTEVVSGTGTREDTNLITILSDVAAEGFEFNTDGFAGGHNGSDLVDIQVSGGNLSKAAGEGFTSGLTPIFEVLPEGGGGTFINISFITPSGDLQTLSDVVDDANDLRVSVDEFLEVHIRTSYLNSPLWADKDFSREYF